MHQTTLLVSHKF